MAELHRNLLILFMKAPLPGTVKTRLQPQLTPEQSLNLYKSMGLDLKQNLSSAKGYKLEIHYSPPEHYERMVEWLGSDIPFTPQRGRDLGEKMRNSILSGLHRGFQNVIIIGSDLPTLTPADIENAFQHLSRKDVVLGPTTDGGYYLIGAGRDHPEIFQGIQWSSTTVLEQTLKKAKAAGITIQLLITRSDIDTFQEVNDLWISISQNPSLGEKILHTYTALKKIFLR